MILDDYTQFFQNIRTFWGSKQLYQPQFASQIILISFEIRVVANKFVISAIFEYLCENLRE